MQQDVHAVVEQHVVCILVVAALAQAVQVVEGHLLSAVGWIDITQVRLHNLTGFWEDHVEVDCLLDSDWVVLIEAALDNLDILVFVNVLIY